MTPPLALPRTVTLFSALPWTVTPPSALPSL